MRNAIITAVAWPVNLVASVLFWTVKRLDTLGWWLQSRRKSPPKHRITFPDPKAQERFDGPTHRLNIDVSEPEQDWLPATPEVKNTPCPDCGSDEFPLVVYDNQLMCPVCRDEAVITDKTFGHTGPMRAVRELRDSAV